MKTILPLCLSVLCVSCGTYPISHYSSAAPAPVLGSPVGESTQVARKIIKNGRMELEVKEVETVTNDVEGLVKAKQGRVVQKSEGESVSMEIRVPSQHLESLMEQCGALGKVESQRVWEEDVTEEYIDVEAKLKNMKLLRARLQKLYAKTEKVEELLKLEKELARVQGQIDSIEGRLKVMKRDVAYSEFDLTIEKQTIPGPVGAIGSGISWVTKKLWVLN